MRVKDWMSPDPVTVTPDTPVREARRLLGYYGVRHLPVVSGGHVVGMISDRDVCFGKQLTDQAGGAAEDEASTALVESAMSTPVHDIGPGEPIEAAARLMLSRRISALAVVDADVDRRLVGLVTTTDCLLASLHGPGEI